jgi:hypothetical protein
MPKKDLELIVERMKHLRQLAVEASDALMRQTRRRDRDGGAGVAPSYPPRRRVDRRNNAVQEGRSPSFLMRLRSVLGCRPSS